MRKTAQFLLVWMLLIGSASPSDECPARVYYVPFQLETYGGYTIWNIRGLAWCTTCLKDAAVRSEVLELLSRGRDSSSFDAEQVRLWVEVPNRGDYLVDTGGRVYDGSRIRVLEKAPFERLSKILSGVCPKDSLNARTRFLRTPTPEELKFGSGVNSEIQRFLFSAKQKSRVGLYSQCELAERRKVILLFVAGLEPGKLIEVNDDKAVHVDNVGGLMGELGTYYAESSSITNREGLIRGLEQQPFKLALPSELDGILSSHPQRACAPNSRWR